MLTRHLVRSGFRVLVLAVLAFVGAPGAGRAQDNEPLNSISPPPSDYVVEGPNSRLELVRDEDARGPTDVAVLTSAGQFPCHLPCTLNVPQGVLHLMASGLDQRLDLQLPVARFRVRAGEPVPWLESMGGMAAGLGLGAVGTWVVLNTVQVDELVGGAALITLGVVFFGLSLALLLIAIAEENGSVELDTFEAALRDGTLARF